MPKAKIPVIEGEAPVRVSTMRVLETQGFQVDGAATSEEALANIRKHASASAVDIGMRFGPDNSILNNCQTMG